MLLVGFGGSRCIFGIDRLGPTADVFLDCGILRRHTGSLGLGGGGRSLNGSGRGRLISGGLRPRSFTLPLLCLQKDPDGSPEGLIDGTVVAGDGRVFADRA